MLVLFFKLYVVFTVHHWIMFYVIGPFMSFKGGNDSILLDWRQYASYRILPTSEAVHYCIHAPRWESEDYTVSKQHNSVPQNLWNNKEECPLLFLLFLLFIHSLFLIRTAQQLFGLKPSRNNLKPTDNKYFHHSNLQEDLSLGEAGAQWIRNHVIIFYIAHLKITKSGSQQCITNGWPMFSKCNIYFSKLHWNKTKFYGVDRMSSNSSSATITINLTDWQFQMKITGMWLKPYASCKKKKWSLYHFQH